MDPKTVLAVTAGLSAAGFLALSALAGPETVRFAAPAFAVLPVAAYLRKKDKENPLRAGPLLNEAPSVIAMMSTVLSSGESLDAAVRYVSENGPVHTRKLFLDLVTAADSRTSPDIRNSLYDLISRFPPELGPYRRSLYMVVSASDASGPERSRLLKEATDSALSGLKEAGEEYSSKLQTPSMLVFALGIMVPMILLSIVPLLGIGGEFGSGIGLPDGVLEFIILALIPAAVGLVMVSVRGRNPMMNMDGKDGGWWRLGLLMAIIPLYLVLGHQGLETRYALTASAVIASALVLAVTVRPYVGEIRRRKTENALKDMLFDLGNRLVSGENFDSALVSALSVRKECRGIADALSKEYVLCRGDVPSAVRSCISPVSPGMASLICDICTAADRDIADAGRLATALAHQIQDQDAVRRNIGNKLRNLSDMMTGTAAVFAPLILGMSIMMMSPLAPISGMTDTDGMFGLVSVFIMELTVLMGMFACLLGGRFSSSEVSFRIGAILPVAMVILTVCSGLTF